MDTVYTEGCVATSSLSTLNRLLQGSESRPEKINGSASALSAGILKVGIQTSPETAFIYAMTVPPHHAASMRDFLGSIIKLVPYLQ
jgi:hypothetical protein